MNEVDKAPAAGKPGRRPRVLFLGMTSPFAYTPLARLLAAGIDICGVLVPAGNLPGVNPASPIRRLRPEPPASGLPVLNPYREQNLLHLAWEHQLPLWEMAQPGAPATQAVLRELSADVACVACFSLRLPEAFLGLFPAGVLNLHPSLLPAHRGPAPLFWTFRAGEEATGVTVHFIDADLDTGDIALQAPLDLPDGISGEAADRRCGELGADLLLDALRRLEQNTLPRRPQPAGGTYEPWPTAADFRLDPAWPARRAFNFMRGTAEWGVPYPIDVAGGSLHLSAALAFDETRQLDHPVIYEAHTVWLQFNPGALRATRHEPPAAGVAER